MEDVKAEVEDLNLSDDDDSESSDDAHPDQDKATPPRVITVAGCPDDDYGGVHAAGIGAPTLATSYTQRGK